MLIRIKPVEVICSSGNTFHETAVQLYDFVIFKFKIDSFLPKRRYSI